MKKFNIDIDEFKDYYKEHSNSSTMLFYNIGYDELFKLINDAEIERHTRKENIKLTNLERYGSEKVPREIDKVRTDKIKQTCLERYGVSNIFQKESSRNKLKNVLSDPEKEKERIKKIKQTKLDKYGNENYCNIEKIKQTCLERYGVSSSFMAEQVKDKIKQTCLERYGVEYSAQIEQRKEKAKQTCLERYGKEYYNNKEKTKETCIEKYGVSSPMKAQEVLDKVSSTCSERYGVRWACMRKEARLRGNNSKPNQEFDFLLNSLNIEHEREYSIGRYTYDFLINKKNTFVEINPYVTHNSTYCIYNRNPINKYYHQNKSKIAKENGFRCIHVFDWDDINKISMLLNDRETVFGRKCKLNLVLKEDEKDFLNEYHIQGYVKSSVCVGLYYNNELVSLMSFGKPRYNKKYEWELLRYCSIYNVIGGAEKLFKYFLKACNPNSIISYCDTSKFNGNIYDKLGFKQKNKTEPSKHWYNPKTKKHITDNLLRQRGFDQLLGKEYGFFGKGTSNEELMLSHGFVEIYDCGQVTYIYENKYN